MTHQSARKLSLTLLIAGLLTVFAGEYWWPLYILGFLLMLSYLIPDFLYNRCPHCRRHLGRNYGEYCQHCGGKLDESDENAE